MLAGWKFFKLPDFFLHRRKLSRYKGKSTEGVCPLLKKSVQNRGAVSQAL
jgi:hypothetical protein